MKVIIIDDHTLFRMGLTELLERSSIEVIGSTGDGMEGISMALELQPDAILLDLRMPESDGITILKKMLDNGITIPVSILTTSSDEKDLIESLQAGAKGYLLKDMEPTDLVNALHRLTMKQTVVAPELANTLARAIQGKDDNDKVIPELSLLTPREGEILCLIADGQSNKTIARNLGITDGTVKLHVKGILRKLNVKSRVEAAVIAVEREHCAKNKSG